VFGKGSEFHESFIKVNFMKTSLRLLLQMPFLGCALRRGAWPGGSLLA
jgi:hypothetical protein